MMYGQVKCSACGTKTYARRTHCPRCRAALTPAPTTPSAPDRKRAATPVAVLCVVALALTAGTVARIGTTGSPAVKAASPAPAATVQPGGVTRSAIEHEVSTTAASMDLSRGGLAAYAKGDVAGSVERFTAAVDADPKNAEALNNLGQALVRSGRARDAIPYFDRAVALSSAEWTYHFNRARAYGELQEWSRAIVGYREAAGLFPQDYATAYNLARALQANGDVNGAIDEYQRAINLAPGEPDFPLALASALERARRPADAVKAYQRYLELQDSGPTAEKVKKRIAELESHQ